MQTDIKLYIPQNFPYVGQEDFSVHVHEKNLFLVLFFWPAYDASRIMHNLFRGMCVVVDD